MLKTAGVVLLLCLAVTLAAWDIAANWGRPRPGGCVKPTAMPATWYGDCR